jgi:ClpP class serine protease
MTITTIATPTGTYNIDAALFNGYTKEAFEHLTNAAEAITLFKEVVETVAENTGMSKAQASKYLKARHEAKTKEVRELGDLFTALDKAVEGLVPLC